MTALSKLLEASVVSFTAATTFSGVVTVICCLLAAEIFVRAELRQRKLLYFIGFLVTVSIGILRGTQHDASWTARLFTLLPYAFIASVTQKKYILKSLVCVFAVCTVGEIIQYVSLMMFYEYKFAESRALELSVEITVCAAMLIVLLLLHMRSAKKKNGDTAFSKVNIPLVLLVIGSLGMFVVSMVLLGINHAQENKAEFLFTLITIPLIAVTAGYAVKVLVNTKLSEESYRRQLDEQIRHYALMDAKNEELRVFRHDFPKKMRPMLLYMKQGQTDEAIGIAEDFCLSVEASKPRFCTGNYRLDTVLECEQQLAQEDGIRIVFKAGGSFPAEGIEPDDIYTIFPNALDNAIEACRAAGGGEITLVSRMTEEKVYVTITNPFTGRLNTKNGELQTSKADKASHGYGMKSIKKAAAKYGSDNCEASVENGMFVLKMNLRFHKAL